MTHYGSPDPPPSYEYFFDFLCGNFPDHGGNYIEKFCPTIIPEEKQCQTYRDIEAFGEIGLLHHAIVSDICVYEDLTAIGKTVSNCDSQSDNYCLEAIEKAESNILARYDEEIATLLEIKSLLGTDRTKILESNDAKIRQIDQIIETIKANML